MTTVQFTPTQADYVAANQLWFRRAPARRWTRWLLIAVAILAPIGLVLQVMSGRSLWDAMTDQAAILVFLAVLIALPLINRVLLPRQVRKMFAQRPSMHDPVTVEWDDERITFTARFGTSIQLWSELYRTLVDDRLIVFLLSDRMILPLPRRVLTAEQIGDLQRLASRTER